MVDFIVLDVVDVYFGDVEDYDDVVRVEYRYSSIIHFYWLVLPVSGSRICSEILLQEKERGIRSEEKM